MERCTSRQGPWGGWGVSKDDWADKQLRDRDLRIAEKVREACIETVRRAAEDEIYWTLGTLCDSIRSLDLEKLLEEE